MRPDCRPGVAASPAVDVTQGRFVTCLGCGGLAEVLLTGRPKRYAYCAAAACQRAAAAARKRDSRRRRAMPVTTVTFGTNAELIAGVAGLYLSPGDAVADVTYSTGRFWGRVDVSRFRFLASDIDPSPRAGRPVLAADFRALPYRDASLDAVVFDPPYLHAPGKGMFATTYNGRATTDMASYGSIMGLYRDGMAEAARVLKPGGQLWVKCKDTLASERQRYSHIAVYEMAAGLGMYARDLFLLVPPAPGSVVTGRWPRQLHARKVHSYLWIMEAGGYRRRG